MSSATQQQQHLFPTTIITNDTKMLKYQHIAPLPMAADGKTRKINQSNRVAPYNPDSTQSVLRRNARERNRVKQVNNSFARLRQHIPQTIITDLTKGGGRGPQKKVSKVDTLRIAVEYIRRLQDILEDLNGGIPIDSFASSGGSSFLTTSCDTASNSSFLSSSSSTSSASSTGSPAYQPNASSGLYYQQSASPLPAMMETNLQQQQQQQLNYNNSTALLSPVSLNSYSPQHQTQLDQQCHSPSSSFNSSLSFDSGTYEVTNSQELSPPLLHQHHNQQVVQQTAQPFNGNLQLKFEPYDAFNLDEEDCTPDDEEILDYISLWQEQ